MSPGFSSRIRHTVEVIVAAFLFVLQNMPAVGPWISLMFIPLGYYLFLYFLRYPEYLGHNLLILLSPKAFLGQIVTLAGFMIFLVACVQFLGKREEIIRTGLYSVVRHPQYLGLVVMTLGLSIICIQLRSRPGVLYTWLVEVFGYVLLAWFEERHLIKEHKLKYQEYRRKTPFLFPIPSPIKIPQPIFSIIITILIVILCLLL